MSPAAPSSSASSRRLQEQTQIKSEIFGRLDLAIVGAIVAFALLLMASSGARRGVELMPWPDGLEYAAQAVNIDRGLGPVLHFGGYSYPSRYPEGYPLILAVALPITGHNVARLFFTTIAIGIVAIVALYGLALRLFGRVSAAAAAIVLALSPVFVTYSTLVLSDVPTLAVTILSALALAFATMAEGESMSARTLAMWLIFGVLAGFTVLIRPTNATMLAGVALALFLVPPKEGLGSSMPELIAFGTGFAAPIAFQLAENMVHLGHPFASGYAWWVPEVYGAAGRTFSSAYLFGPTLPRNPHGNVPIYLTSLAGLDGMLGDVGDMRFFLYPFAAAAFAVIGIVIGLRDRERRAASRVILFGLGYLAALLALYAFYIFTDVAFILPGAFVIFIAAGYGIAAANLWMRTVFADSNRKLSSAASAAGVLLLDVLLVGSLLIDAGSRLNANPPESVMVPALQTLDRSLPPGATIISNVSLEFLDLYMSNPTRRFIGLDALDPGEHFTDYHLRRLYEKRAGGWKGPLPPIVFEQGELSKPVADFVASNLAHGTPVVLVLAAPESQSTADTLKHELDDLQQSFKLEPVAQNPAIAVYQLSAPNQPH